MMGRFPLLCPALFFFLSPFFSECTSTQVRMAELPGNSQKPLAFGTICPAAFLLSLIRKEWGWMQSNSSPLDVMRLCKLVLLYSFSTPSFLPSASSCSPSFFLCFRYFHLLSKFGFPLILSEHTYVHMYALNQKQLSKPHTEFMARMPYV